MKRLLLLLLIGCSSVLYSQPVILRGGEIKDLKDCVTKYTTICLIQGLSVLSALVSTDEGLIWYFAENNSDKKMKFASITEVFNYMDRNGWRYVDKIEDELSGKKVYLFEKKESK